MTRKFDIAILGATGAVGQTVLEILAERQFPVGKLIPLASKKSVGNTVEFKNKPILIQDADGFDFSTVQICFCAVDAELAKKYAPIAAQAGCVVIDKSSQFRYDADVPLVIPEVNPDAIAEYRERNIIATPNCSTIPLLVALKPIYDAVGIERINVATYQSVSGTGKAGIDELSQQVTDLLNGKSVTPKVYPVQIAFNLIPHIDSFLDNGYTKEEMKIVWESKKILNDPNILINPTAVRVPVFYGHSEAVHIETREKITAEAARHLLTESPGIIVIDEHEDGGYPTPMLLAEREDAVFVGRIREDISHHLGLDLWIVADNIRKGAALNAIQIAEILIRDYL
ncbi:MAG TPA: aspartate-semialdehyde dehydrogenase [Gammaproteobacteria bacterium]|nr:aspartate-semialdehyde dehydrogenase [Gammaproteobacteria bacterium]